MERKSIIQSVDRALFILQVMSDNPVRKYSLQELALQIGIEKSSVYRLLNTLADHGLVRQVDGNKKFYQLGFSTFKLAGSCLKGIKIPALLNPVLRRIADETHENAHLAVRSAQKAVFIDREIGSNTISSNTAIGDSEDLYCTAIGKTLICDMPEQELITKLNSIERIKYTDKTVTDVHTIAASIQGVRQNGYAVDDEEFELNVYCIAAPVFDYLGKIPCALGISGPKQRIARQNDFYINIIKDAAVEASALLGFSN